MADPPKTDDLYFRAAKAMFWVVFAGLFSFAFVQAWPAVRWLLDLLTPFILGLILAYVLHPIVLVVQHKLKLGRFAGILVVALCVIVLITGFLAILVPILYQQISAALGDLIDFFKGFNDQATGTGDAPQGWIDRIRDNISPELFKSIEDLLANAKENLKELLKPVARTSADAVSGSLSVFFSALGWVGNTAAVMTFTVIVTFYYLADMDRIPVIIRRIIPGDHPERIWKNLVQADRAVGGFLRGQLIACIGVGVLVTLLLLVIGPRKYALLIGFTAGAVNFIPYLGPTVGATPAIVWALFASALPFFGVDPTFVERLMQVGLVLIGFGAVQSIDGFIFQPFIVGKQAALHPLAVMLALFVGAQFGIGGMILAVPLACVFKVFYIEFYWKNTRDFQKAARETEEADGSGGG